MIIWDVEFVEYEAVYEMCKRKFGTSPYRDDGARKICERILKQSDVIPGDNLLQVKRNLIAKIGSERIDILSITNPREVKT